MALSYLESVHVGVGHYEQRRVRNLAIYLPRKMGRKRKKDRATTTKKGVREGFSSRFGLERETLHAIAGVAAFVVAVFFLLAAFRIAGPAGRLVYKGLSTLLGYGYFLLPTLGGVLGVTLFQSLHKELFATTKIVGSLLFFITGLGLIELAADTRGGIIGGWIAHPLMALFDTVATGVILGALFIISLMVILNTRPTREMFTRWKRRQEKTPLALTKKEEEAVTPPGATTPPPEEETQKIVAAEKTEGVVSPSDDHDEKGFLKGLFAKSRRARSYASPPLSLLEGDRGTPRAGDIKANANIIKRTLANFGIDVEIEEVEVGPSVTRYAIKPAEGVRLSRILSLQNNLELALAAHPVRIEAPIPGRSLVGIEIPNTAKTTVGLATLLGEKTFQGSDRPLYFTLGRSVSGEARFADLGRMPHLLVAGATNSGKSVSIHALITSLVYRNGPDFMKFVMVDPKRVELTLYNGIPHLLTPVITDPKKAVLALKWLIGEMERRYNILEGHRVRDIGSYHTNMVAPAFASASDKSSSDRAAKDNAVESERELPERMPYIIVIIDELADIMATYPRELEASIVRLAQMSRAVGIHLVLSTQRPSVNVITGLIKANIPARIALQVASQVDSRTILDMAGAEKLLGAGDMLFMSADMSKPVRIQSGFISEAEVKRVADHLRTHYEGDGDLELELTNNDILTGALLSEDAGENDDELYEEAREIVIEAGKASTSYLQRKLRVGYARAARLMDILEERGVIGPADGAKPRDVLVPRGSNTQQETEQMF